MSRFASNRRRASRRGAVTLEFGLVALPLIILIAATFDLGRFLATRTALRSAVGEVTRAAMTNAQLSGCTSPKTFALSKVAMLRADLLTVCVTQQPQMVTTNATYSFAFIIPILGTAPRTLVATTSTPVLTTSPPTGGGSGSSGP